MVSSSNSKKAMADSSKRNWLDLPRDVMFTIFQKLRAIDVLTNAHVVCSVWRNISKDPFLWRTIDLHHSVDGESHKDRLLCRRAIDYSSGNLLDISIDFFANDDLLRYIADSASHLRRLRLVYCYTVSDEGLSEVAKNLPQLEELDISMSNLSKMSLEAIGRYCPQLKSIKFNMDAYKFPLVECDDEALAIAETMPGIRRIQLFGNKLTNDGLLAILDGCPHLESLDLRQCFNLNLGESLGKRCAEKVKVLRLPYDSTDDYPFKDELYYQSDEEEDQYEVAVLSDGDYGEFEEYDGDDPYGLDMF